MSRPRNKLPATGLGGLSSTQVDRVYDLFRRIADLTSQIQDVDADEKPLPWYVDVSHIVSAADSGMRTVDGSAKKFLMRAVQASTSQP